MTQKSWRERIAFNFGIFDATNGWLLGSVWLSRVDRKHRYANVGYWVRSDYTKQGIATTAVRLIVPFGFTEAGMNRLEILASVENKASQRVAVKVGARREGILRQRLRLENRFHDAVMFSLTREDCRPES
jgi:RimJ/RimL family protein N-acetyltransferase